MAYTDVQIVHQDKMLTNFSKGYQNGAMIGRQLLPELRVAKQSDKYYIFGKEAWAPTDDVRAPGGEAHELPGIAVSTDTYFCTEHAQQTPVADEEVQNADSPLAPRVDATQYTVDKIEMTREIAYKTLLATSANYSHKITPSGKWDDFTNGDPIADVRLGMKTIKAHIFRPPNVLFLPDQVIDSIIDHPDFLDRIKYTQFGMTTEDVLARIFRVERVISPLSGYDTAREGQAESLDYIWPDCAILMYVTPTPAMKSPTFGYTFCWPYDNAGGALRPVERWREERRVSDVVRVRFRYDFKVTNWDAAYFFNDVLS